MEGFYMQKGVVGELFTKEKKGVFLGQVNFLWVKAGEDDRVFIMQMSH